MREFNSFNEVKEFVGNIDVNLMDYKRRDLELLLEDLKEAKRYIRKEMSMFMTMEVFDLYDLILSIIYDVKMEIELDDYAKDEE